MEQNVPHRKPPKDCRFSESSVWGSELDSNCQYVHRSLLRLDLRIRYPQADSHALVLDTRSVIPIWRSTPLTSSGPRSDDKPPPAKSARMLQPGIEANRSCSGVEFMAGKDLLALTSVAIKNPHCTNHLQYFLLFFYKMQDRAVVGYPLHGQCAY